MDRKKKLIFIPILTFIIFISSLSAILIINFYNIENENLHIEFTPKKMKSYPNHTAWLLLDIRTID